MNDDNVFHMNLNYYKEFVAYLRNLIERLIEKNMDLLPKAKSLRNALNDFITSDCNIDMKFIDYFFNLDINVDDAIKIQDENELQNKIIQLIQHVISKKTQIYNEKLEKIDEFQSFLIENQENSELEIEEMDLLDLTLGLQNQKKTVEQDFFKLKNLIVNDIFHNNFLPSSIDRPKKDICKNLLNTLAFEINLENGDFSFKNNDLIQLHKGTYQAVIYFMS